ncbi:hypothetical protein LINPERHAP2_LOCUS19032, partial [Linum perenne]
MVVMKACTLHFFFLQNLPLVNHVVHISLAVASSSWVSFRMIPVFNKKYGTSSFGDSRMNW